MFIKPEARSPNGLKHCAIAQLCTSLSMTVSIAVCICVCMRVRM